MTAALGEMPHWKLSVIPQTIERYMVLTAEFKVGEIALDNGKKRPLNFTLQFLDSMQFVGCSLESMMRVMQKSDCAHTFAMQRTRPMLSDDTLMSKGVFPYDFVRRESDLQEAAFPSQDAFHNFLTDTACSDADYARAVRAWNEFGASSLGDYMMGYLEMDIRQLADIFESYRRLSLSDDGLDPVHYISCPGMSFDSALKCANAELELLTDNEMYRMFERGIRGGMTFTNLHHVSADNDTFLLPVDANNLYGQALSMPLPVGDFRWVDEQELQLNWSEDSVLALDDDDEFAFLFELDLVYPTDIHRRTEELPLAPEKLTIAFEDFPAFMQQLWRQMNGDRKYRGTSKLMLTCRDKLQYVVHSRLLKFYLRQGLRIQRFHRAIQFRQAAFFGENIQRNSSRRAQAIDEFKKSYYKSKNNSLFGKTMENVRKRHSVRICTDNHQAEVLSSNPRLKDFFLVNDKLSVFQLGKETVVLNRPVYMGQCVLDLSKLVMYELLYEKLIPTVTSLGGSLQLCGGDTDSFFLCVRNVDVERQLLPRMQADGLLDASNYPPQHELYSTKHKAQLGCVKDESAGVRFKEWLLLRPKLYSFKSHQGQYGCKKAAKGIQRAALRKLISHDDFVSAYENLCEMDVRVRRIMSKRHQLYTIQQQKRALTVWEDKRAWIAANVSLPFGHVALSQ
jgi:hypothetical protein